MKAVGNTVIAAVDLDVIIHIDDELFEFLEFVRLRWQGPHGRKVQFPELTDTRTQFLLKGECVQVLQHRSDRLIEFLYTEEVLGTKSAQNAIRRKFNSKFDQTFILRFSRSGWGNFSVIMAGKIQIGFVDFRIFTTGPGHGRLEFIADDNLGHGPEKFKHPHMRPNPAAKLLIRKGLYIKVIGASQYANKNLSMGHLTRDLVNHIHRRACKVNKHFLPRFVMQAHRHIPLITPLQIENAKMTIRVPVRINSAVLMSGSLQRHPPLR